MRHTLIRFEKHINLKHSSSLKLVKSHILRYSFGAQIRAQTFLIIFKSTTGFYFVKEAVTLTKQTDIRKSVGR